MHRNMSHIIFFTVFLVYSSAVAMKRSQEQNLSIHQKKQKTTSHKDLTPILEKRDGFYICQKELSCRYTSSDLTGIEIHHERHKDVNSLVCDICDYRGVNKLSLKQHITKKHKELALSSEAVTKQVEACHSSNKKIDKKQIIKVINTQEKCGYCGIKGKDLDRHMQLYHTPHFGKMSYYASFPLQREKNVYKSMPRVRDELITISSDFDDESSSCVDSEIESQ